MSISTVTRVLTQLAELILQGRALADAIDRVARTLRLSKQEVRAIWRAAGVTVRDVRQGAQRLMPWMIRRAVLA
jgi:hypothetical protein